MKRSNSKTKPITPILPDRKTVKQRFDPLSKKKQHLKEEKRQQALIAVPAKIPQTEEEKMEARQKQVRGEECLITDLFQGVSSEVEEKEKDRDNKELWGSDSGTEEDSFQKIDDSTPTDFMALAQLFSEKIGIHKMSDQYCTFLQELLRLTIPALFVPELDDLARVLTVRRNELLTERRTFLSHRKTIGRKPQSKSSDRKKVQKEWIREGFVENNLDSYGF